MRVRVRVRVRVEGVRSPAQLAVQLPVVDLAAVVRVDLVEERVRLARARVSARVRARFRVGVGLGFAVGGLGSASGLGSACWRGTSRSPSRASPLRNSFLETVPELSASHSWNTCQG